MPAEGICLRVTHLRVHPDSVALYDVNDGRDTLGVFRKAGAIYIPYGQTVELVYTSSLALSFEIGALREFIDQGLLFAEFVWGTTAGALVPSILDEGILLTNTPTSINFVGSGVTATNVGDAVTVTIPGGGAATDHATLTNLGWTASGHIGTAGSFATFDGAGIASVLTGVSNGDTIYFDGTAWTRLPPGTAGQVLQTNGAGSAPTWVAPGGGATDHSLLTNLGWSVSGHTGSASTLAAFNGAGAAINISTTVSGDVSGTLPGPLTVTDLTMAGEAQGDVLYFDGTNWTVLPAGVAGQVLQTQGPGADPIWAASGAGTDHSTLTNLGWLVSAHTGTAGSLAAFDGAGATSFITGVVDGDILYFDGAAWSRLAPGTTGEFLQTQGAGSPPVWATASVSWKQPVDLKGYLGTRTVVQIDALTPTIGQSVVAGSAGTPTAGTSDLLAVGDVAEFDGTSWKKILGAVGGFPPAGTRALVETDPITLYGPLIDGTDEGKFVEWDGTSLAPASLVSPSDGDAVLVKGELSVNENKQYVYDGAVPSGLWVQFGGSGLVHSGLSDLAWAVSGHTGTAGSLATFDGSGAAAFATGVSEGDILYFDGTTWARLAPGAVDGNPLTTQTAGAPPVWDDIIAVDTITESTANNGVLVNGIRNYGKLATDPAVGPAPTDGDTYYNTSLRMQMAYDGIRGKWLSVESTSFQFGRDGNVQAGQYYRAADGRVMSDTLGWFAERSGTVVSLTWTRTNAASITYDIVHDGISIATVGPTLLDKGRDISLNADFTFGDILAVLNDSGGSTAQNVIAVLRVRWRA